MEVCPLFSRQWRPTCLLLQVFIFSRSEVAPGVYECWGNFAESWGLKAYVTWMALAVFILPVLIITVCQVPSQLPEHNHNPAWRSSFQTNATSLDITSFSPQVRIFKEIHNNLYLKSSCRLQPTASLSGSKEGNQRGGGGIDASRGSSCFYLYASPLVLNDIKFESGPVNQLLPMGPLRLNGPNIPTHSAAKPGETRSP